MKWKIFLTFALVLALGLVVLAAACDDDDDDDDDDDNNEGDVHNPDDYPVRMSGTISYDGDKLLADSKMLVAIVDFWPMSGAPTEFVYIDIPESGFPMEYRVGFEHSGEFFPLAALDVDPDDLFGMNVNVDPLAVPTASVTLQEGENDGVNFVLVDPEDIGGDDDDDDNDDDNDTAGDDDTAPQTGIAGTLTYAGSKEGDKVVFGFWTGLPAGPPDESAEFDVPVGGFPFDYVVETSFTGDYRVVAFLDVDPNDGESINFAVDPNNWSLTMSPITIQDGALTTYDITLEDPK
ncbi:MAG: hypothetical protein P9L99_04605 [Candidatus Lernaella stagnicola]|nr:hypothetical protein [Candidatus Lernaella stagnicola]